MGARSALRPGLGWASGGRWPEIRCMGAKMKRYTAFAVALLLAVPAYADPAGQPEIQFVSDYIRALSDIEGIRANAESDLKTAKNPQEQFSSCVHTTELQMHAMADAANLAATYKLTGDSKETPALLVKYYATKGEMFNSLGGMCATMLQGPKPGVDYGKVAVGMPKLRADMEYIDKNLLLMSVMVFNALISPTPDKQGHMSRLMVTRKERDQLVHQINTGFKKLDAKNSNYTVSSAAILRDYLARKGYKCADDPA